MPQRTSLAQPVFLTCPRILQKHISMLRQSSREISLPNTLPGTSLRRSAEL
jgi:hypothetical protein